MNLTFADIVVIIIGFINMVIPLLASFALLLLLWSGVRYIYASGGEGHGAATQRNALVWSLVALFILFSVWGILRVMCISILNSASCGNPSTEQITE